MESGFDLGPGLSMTALIGFLPRWTRSYRPRSEQVDYVDMRYTNGFAIGWKDRNPMRVKLTEGSEPHV